MGNQVIYCSSKKNLQIKKNKYTKDYCRAPSPPKKKTTENIIATEENVGTYNHNNVELPQKPFSK